MFVGDDEWFCRVAINDVSEADMKTLHSLQPIEEQNEEWTFLSFRDLSWVAATVADNHELFSKDFVKMVRAVCERDEVEELDFYQEEYDEFVDEDEDDDV